MTKPPTAWTVLPHGEIEHLSGSVATVTGTLAMPLTTLERRMTVVRLNDGRLVVYSAMALDDEGMRALLAMGTPAFLVVPSHLHRLDAPAWRARFPSLVVVAPSGARVKVEQLVAVETSSPDLEDASVRFVEVAGTGGREGALEIEEDGRLTLVLNDLVGNLPISAGLVLRTLGFATERPRIPRMARRMLLKDPSALRRQLEAWAERPIARVVVSHGRPIEHDIPDVLREMARTL
ncbi:MAG: hypothetical protein J0L92_19450 [Deltaproteobacteria bacterium]|nr:hypothetical protein [Deltaproteobacteria bacterium]